MPGGPPPLGAGLGSSAPRTHAGPSHLDQDIDFSALETDDFDEKKFILQHRRRVPLFQLQKALEIKNEDVKSRLIEQINEKYSDFVNLSARMRHLEVLVEPIVEPLQQTCSVCDGFVDKLDEVCGKARAEILRRKVISSKKRLILSLQEHLRLLGKTQQLFLETAKTADRSGPLPSAAPDDHITPPATITTADPLHVFATLEVVAGNLHKLRLWSALNQFEESDTSAAFSVTEAVADFEHQVKAFEGEVLARLRGSLEQLLVAQVAEAEAGVRSGAAPVSADAHPEDAGNRAAFQVSKEDLTLAFSYLCRAFVLLGKEREVETIAADALLGPTLKDTTNLSLKQYFASVLEKLALHTSDSLFLKLARACPNSVHLVCGIGKPVLDQVVESYSNVFIPAGMLDHFADNYVAYSHFKAILERQMKKSERRRWAGEVAVYDRKWQIQVYFSIREKELVFKFTEGVVENKKLFPGGQELGGGPGSAPRRYKLPATEALFSQLQRIWQRDQIYLDGLFARFLGLSCKYLHMWIRHVGLDFLQSMQSRTKLIQDAWPENADLLEHGPLVIFDCRAIAGELNFADENADFAAQLLAEAERAAVKDHSPDTSAASSDEDDGRDDNRSPVAGLVAALFEETRTELFQLGERLTAAVLAKVLENISACVAENIKRIPSLYRMMNKPDPVAALPYVSGQLLAPLDGLLERTRATAGGRGSEELGAEWTARVLREVALSFEAQATAVTEQVELSYRSLERMSGGGGGKEDMRKILMQLKFDIAEFLRVCRERYGVSDLVIHVKKLEDGLDG